MAETVRAITWEAPEHNHNEKTADWYWALGIIAVAAAAAMIVFGNTLFGLVILLGAATMAIVALRHPKMLLFAVTQRGVRMGNDLFPYTTLSSYRVDEEHPDGPQVLIRSSRMFTPLLIFPVPEEYVDDIEALLSARLPEEELEEPLSHKLLEFLGF